MSTLHRITATDQTLATIEDALSVCVEEVDGITGEREELMRHALDIVREWRSKSPLFTAQPDVKPITDTWPLR